MSAAPHPFPDRIVLASGNVKKRRELERILTEVGIPLETLVDHPALEAPEETGQTFAANARLKAAYYALQIGRWCVADDSGIEVDALDGAPGVHSARFAGEPCDDEANNDTLLARLSETSDEGRTARYRCAIALAEPDGRVVFESEGSTEGRILHQRQGSEGFGYDPLFFSTEISQCFGEVEAEVKDRVSHRGRALKDLERWLRGRDPS